MWIIIIGVIIFIIYKVVSFGNTETEQKVTSQGGMQVKYKVLIDYFMASSTSRITKLTKDTVVISSTTTTFSISFIGGQTEIVMSAFLPLLGQISNKWRHPDHYPQKEIIEEIEMYISKKMEDYKKLADSNIEQYINQ